MQEAILGLEGDLINLAKTFLRDKEATQQISSANADAQLQAWMDAPSLDELLGLASLVNPQLMRPGFTIFVQAIENLAAAKQDRSTNWTQDLAWFWIGRAKEMLRKSIAQST